jgi:hypothetical protein
MIDRGHHRSGPHRAARASRHGAHAQLEVLLGDCRDLTARRWQRWMA